MKTNKTMSLEELEKKIEKKLGNGALDLGKNIKQRLDKLNK